MNNTSINITIEELRTLNENVNTTKDEISTTINNIESCLSELETNITGASVNSSINSISTKIDEVNAKMVAAFQQLNDFLSSQMKNYAGSYEEASAKLQAVLNFIDNNFN